MNGAAVTSTAGSGGNSDAATASDRRNVWRVTELQFRGPLRVRRAGEREALLLTFLCALDMYTTLWWVMTGSAVESNALLAWTFNHHPLYFVALKSAACLPALLLAPRLARNHPRFTVWLLRGILVAYIGYYLMNVK